MTSLGAGAGVALEARVLRRSYAGARGLDGVDLTLRRGEIHALVGPNGAGKTSLIRALCGRLRLDAGEVRLLGADPREPAVRRRLGLVPQEIALYGELSVRENLELCARLAGLQAARLPAAVASALDWIGLADRGGSRVAALSGGQKRRVNLAAGTLHAPEVLLLDEPTVGVDPAARERVHAMLRELRGRGLALLLATHDLDQAAELADRIGVLVDGRIQAEGSLAELVAATFGGRREIGLRLAADPGPDAVRALEAEGLAAGGDRRDWAGPLAGEYEALAGLGRRLAARGVELCELRLREPGLRGVFFRLAGREIDA